MFTSSMISMRQLILKRNWLGTFCRLRHLYQQQSHRVTSVSEKGSLISSLELLDLGSIICRRFTTLPGPCFSSIKPDNHGKVAVFDHADYADSDGSDIDSGTDEFRSQGAEVKGYNMEEVVGHIPVMTNEVLDTFEHCEEKKLFIDMTFGGGGHTRSILQKFPECRVIALDRDPSAYGIAQNLASESSSERVIPLLGKFSDMPALLAARDITPGSIDGILFDVGASSMQYDQMARGFSLSMNGPLDMRMDADRDPNQVTAADVVNKLEETDLTSIIKKYGDEKMARKISHAIVEARSAFGRITTTHQLADIVQSVFPHHWTNRKDKLFRHAHVATKTFQALRIFVNNELNELNSGLVLAHHYLKVGGVCVTICFHGLEDRIVKRHFHDIELDQKSNMNIHDWHRNSRVSFSKEEIEEVMKKDWTPFSKKIKIPSELEISQNPRCRSARLRAAIKC